MNPTLNQANSGIGGQDKYGFAINVPTIPKPVPLSAPSTSKATPVVSSQTAAKKVEDITATINQTSDAVAMNNAARAGWRRAEYAPTQQGTATTPAYSSSTPSNILTPEQQIASQPDAGFRYVYDKATGAGTQVPINEPVPAGYTTFDINNSPAVDSVDTANATFKQFSDGTYGQFDASGKYVAPANAKNFNDAKNAAKNLAEIDAINNGTHPLTQEEQGMINSISNYYNKLIAQQELENKNVEGGTRAISYLSGTAGGAYSMGQVNTVISQGAFKVQKLNDEMNDKINAAKQAMKTNDLAGLRTAYEGYQKGVDDRQTTIDNMRLAVASAYEKEETRKATEENAIMNDINTFQAEVAKAGGADDTEAYAEALANKDYNGMVKAAGNILTGGIGGEYNIYKKDSIAHGLTPKSFDEYQTLDANRKAKIAAAGVAGASGYSNSILSKITPIGTKFENDQVVKDYNVIAQQVDSVKNAGNTPTDDIQRIYAFAKVMDPASAVREGEYSTIQAYSTALMQRLGLKTNRVFNNDGFLTDEARKFLLNTLENRLAVTKKSYDNIYNESARKINKITGGTDGKDFLTNYSEGYSSLGDELIKDGEQKLKTLETSLNEIKTTNPKVFEAASGMYTSPNPDTGEPYTEDDIYEAFPELKKQSFNQVGGDTNIASNKKSSFGNMLLGALGVETASASQVPDSVYVSERKDTSAPKGIIAGYNITRYATDPKHEEKIASIINNLGDVATSSDIDSYIKKRAPSSPVTGTMVQKAANKYNVSPQMIMALIQNDSSFGTKGKGARTKNPGNYGNDDTGRLITFKTWDEGVMAVAKWLDKNRV